MANTTFVANVTKIIAVWLNDINKTAYEILGDNTNVAATKAAARTNLVVAGLTDSNSFTPSNTFTSRLNAADTVGGTVDAITATFVPALTALVDKMRVIVRATGANTGAVTFIPDGVGTPVTVDKIVNGLNVALVAGDITNANHVLDLVYDAGDVRWMLLNPSHGNSGSCAAGYVRVGPNLCMKTSATSTSGLVRDTVTALTNPSSDSKALIIYGEVVPRSNNAVALRSANLLYYGEDAGTNQQGNLALSVWEFNATAAATQIGFMAGQFTVMKNTGYALRFTDDAGNQGLASYEIRGYYD